MTRRVRIWLAWRVLVAAAELATWLHPGRRGQLERHPEDTQPVDYVRRPW